jgi:ketosteroid isomerase-like protein
MATDTDLAADTKALATEFLRIFSSGDVSAIGEFVHDDAIWWVGGTVAGISGTHTKQSMLDLLKQVTAVYKKGALQITALSMIAEGARVAVEAESYGELHNGKIYNNFYHFVLHFENGKLREIKEYLDTQHVLDTFFDDA